MDAETILVIILSICLAIFLILGIVATTLLIQIMRKVKNMVDKAEHVAENISTAAQFVKPATIAAAITRFIKKKTKKGSADE